MPDYFGEEEEQAVKQYIHPNTTQKEKDKIYREKLQEPIETLVESILGVYGKKYDIFQGTNYTHQQLKMMGLSYLFKKIYKFDPKRGNKAYSFLGTVLRNYYLKLKKDYDKNKERKLDIDNEELMDKYKDKYLSYEQKHVDDESVIMENVIKWFDKHIEDIFSKEKNIKIARAILKIMEEADNLECFNKKYIYVLIREMTGIGTRKITPVLKKMKDRYKHLRDNYINHGEFISGSVSL